MVRHMQRVRQTFETLGDDEEVEVGQAGVPPVSVPGPLH
jgi:hypothetical protein